MISRSELDQLGLYGFLGRVSFFIFSLTVFSIFLGHLAIIIAFILSMVYMSDRWLWWVVAWPVTHVVWHFLMSCFLVILLQALKWVCWLVHGE